MKARCRLHVAAARRRLLAEARSAPRSGLAATAGVMSPAWTVALASVRAGRRFPAVAMERIWRATKARHLDPQFMAIQYDPVYGILGILSLVLVMEADEGKATGLFSEAVPWNVHITDIPILLKGAQQCVDCCAVIQVVHLKRGHAFHIGRRVTVTHSLREFSLSPAN